MDSDKIFSLVRDENETFGINAERLYGLVSKYRANEPIPEEIWDTYTAFSGSIPHNQNGLILTGLQTECMKIIKMLMKEKNLLVSLPGPDAIRQKFAQATSEFTITKFLEDHYLPILLEKSNQDMEIYYFLSLILKGKNSVLEWIKTTTPKTTDKLIIGNSAYLDFPFVLVQEFVQNPSLAERAKQFFELIAKGEP